LENEKAVLIYAGFVTSLNGVESPGRFVPPAALWPMLRYRCAINADTVTLRRDAFDAVGGFDASLRVCEDWDLWLRLSARYSVELFAAVPESLAVYRMTPGSLSFYAMRLFTARAARIDERCLYGTSGVSRRLLRRRILSFLYYDTSIALREEGSLLDLSFILKSIVFWPFPWRELPMKRYIVAAVMVKQHLFKRVPRLVIHA
jgi:GT2 family glycosyltransferase